MYGVPILAVLIVLPADQITSLNGLIDAMKTVFTVYGGSTDADGGASSRGRAGAGTIAAWLFIWVLAASGSAWIIGAGRAQAAACLDGAGPRARTDLAAERRPVRDGPRLRSRRPHRHVRPACESPLATPRNTSRRR